MYNLTQQLVHYGVPVLIKIMSKITKKGNFDALCGFVIKCVDIYLMT